MEEIDLKEIDAVLPNLLREGLLTEIDCRIIASSKKLLEKKGTLYTVIMSKTKEAAAILTEIFRKMTETLHSKEISISDEENPWSILPSKNPLLNNMIIKHLFGFLHLKDLKRFRLVSRQWNSTAEICLRKRSAIHFRHDALMPETFMAISKYTHPDLPFSSFVFSCDENSSWDISGIEDFMKNWEKNIKEVTFESVALTSKSNVGDQEDLISSYDITPLFINPTNITNLKIESPCFHYDTKTIFDISLEKFVSIKSIHLNYCRVIVTAELQRSHICPLEIYFTKLTCIQNGNVLPRFYYHGLVDFRKALNVNLLTDLNNVYTDMIFDMSKTLFNLNNLLLNGVTLENWDKAKGDVQFLRLSNNLFLEKNRLSIKQLSFWNSKIDLTALPETLELFELNHTNDINCSQSLYLPNLKYLWMDVTNTDKLTYFSNCENLVELTVENGSPRSGLFSLGCVPKSVKRMTVVNLEQIKFTDNSVFELDNLILEGRASSLEDCTAITAQIKAKVLVIVCGEAMTYNTSDIVKLVVAENQAEKFLIGPLFDLYERTPFVISELSQFVDTKSDFYQFENKVGRSRTKEEFERYAKIDQYISDFLNKAYD